MHITVRKMASVLNYLYNENIENGRAPVKMSIAPAE